MCYVDKSIHTPLIIHKALQTIVLYFKLIFFFNQLYMISFKNFWLIKHFN